MVALSFLVVVAVASSDDAPFDAALAAEGARGLAAARTAREGSGPRSLDALGVALRVGCELRVLDGNATLELRAGRRRRRFDVAAPCAGPWPACGRGAPATPLLCAVGWMPGLLKCDIIMSLKVHPGKSRQDECRPTQWEHAHCEEETVVGTEAEGGFPT